MPTFRASYRFFIKINLICEKYFQHAGHFQKLFNRLLSLEVSSNYKNHRREMSSAGQNDGK
jgi:hypothetical protein